jgi:hypothetical protein
MLDPWGAMRMANPYLLCSDGLVGGKGFDGSQVVEWVPRL